MSDWTLQALFGLSAAPTAASPTWTDLGPVIMAGDGVNLARGATNGEQAGAGQFSLTLDLDRMAALHMTEVTGPALLRRPVLLRAKKGAVTRNLGRFHVTDTTTLRDGRRRIRVSGTDAFALWEEAKRGGDMAWHLTQANAVRRWKLDDEGPVAHDAITGAELVELEVGDGGGTETYGTVSWGASTVPCPSGTGAVRIEAADVFGDAGFAGLTGPIPTGLPFAMSAWIRVPEPPVAPESWPAPPFGLYVPALQVDCGSFLRWIGFSVDRTTGGVFPATGWAGPAGAGTAQGAMDCGYGWVHVDYVLPASGSASLWITRVDGVSEDLSAYMSSDRLADFIGSGGGRLSEGPSRVLLGGTTAASGGVLLVKPAAVEVSDLIVAAPASAGRTTLVRAAIGWPGETPSARLTRVAGEAGVPVPTMTATTTPPMTSAADSQTSLMDALREVEGVTLGLLHLQADGTAAILTRSEVEDAAPVASVRASLVLADSDGVTNNTSMLVNSATVTGANVADRSARVVDDASIATYGERAEDRTLATSDMDWLMLSAGWLANRQSDPSEAYGLPSLAIDPDALARQLPAGDPMADLPWTVDVGDVLTLPDVLAAPVTVQVMAVAWSIGANGQWRCTWTVRPHGIDYFDIGSDDIDGPAIIGW